MTDLAKQAVAASLQLEVKKDSLRQRQSGDWSIAFTVAGDAMPNEILSHPMGQRYVAVLVPIDGQEEPIQKKGWRTSNQAGLRCTEATFKRFLYEEYNMQKWASDEEAADLVRHICGVESRKEFDTSDEARKAWLNLESSFQAWLIFDKVI